MLNLELEISSRSLDLLSLKNYEDQCVFIEERKANPIIVSNYIVCMSSIKKNNPDNTQAISQLVIGTELGYIYIIDHSGSKIINKFKLNDVPCFITCLGAYDIDYRIQIATRNNTIYTIKDNNVSTAKIEVPHKIVGLIRTEKQIYVGTMDSMIHCYHPQVILIWFNCYNRVKKLLLLNYLMLLLQWNKLRFKH